VVCLALRNAAFISPPSRQPPPFSVQSFGFSLRIPPPLPLFFDEEQAPLRSFFPLCVISTSVGFSADDRSDAARFFPNRVLCNFLSGAGSFDVFFFLLIATPCFSSLSSHFLRSLPLRCISESNPGPNLREKPIPDHDLVPRYTSTRLISPTKRPLPSLLGQFFRRVLCFFPQTLFPQRRSHKKKLSSRFPTLAGGFSRTRFFPKIVSKGVDDRPHSPALDKRLLHSRREL